MLDELFFKEKADKTRLNYILFSLVLTLIAFITSILLFGKHASAATILITTILLMPAVTKLFNDEELIVRKEKFKHIVKNHKYIFKIFFMIFIGSFLAFFFLQLVTMGKPDFFRTAFDYQINFIENNIELTSLFTDEIMQGNSIAGGINIIMDITYDNLRLILFSFLLSFFYGSGGIFLIVITASILSTLVLYAIKSSALFLPFTLVFTFSLKLMLLPLLAASIAGGILSNAFISEKVRQRYFKNVLKDALNLFLLSVIMVIVISILLIGIMWIGTAFLA